MRNPSALFLAISLSLLPLPALAGAWLQQEGDGQVITTLRYYSTDKLFLPDGSKTKIPDFSKFEIDPYFEYGLFKWMTIGGDIDFASVNNHAPNFSSVTNSKLSSGSIFARFNVYKQGNYMVSLEPALDIPKSIGSDLTPDGTKPIPEMKIDFGYGFQSNGFNHFFDASLQYRKRDDGGLHDMIKADMTLGYRLSDEFMLLTELSQEETFGGVDKGIAGDYDLTKPQVSILYDYSTHFSHQLGVFSDVYGKNVGAGYGMMYSLWYKF